MNVKEEKMKRLRYWLIRKLAGRDFDVYVVVHSGRTHTYTTTRVTDSLNETT